MQKPMQQRGGRLPKTFDVANMARFANPVQPYKIYIYIHWIFKPLGPHAYLQRCPYEQYPGVTVLQFLQRVVLNFGDKSSFDFMRDFLADVLAGLLGPFKNFFKSAMSEFSSSCCWYTGAAPFPPLSQVLQRLAAALTSRIMESIGMYMISPLTGITKE